MHRPRQPTIIKLWNLFSYSKPVHPAFLPEELLRRATERSDLNDFGNMDFIEGLGTFLDSASETDGFYAFGRFYLKQLVTAMLVHRLKLTKLFHTHPEIEQEHIEQPLFVLGLPRSGTTLLFNLLAQDPRHRFMFNWEAYIGQVPPKEKYTFETDPRRKQAEWMLRFRKYLLPELDKLHEFSAGGSEECTPILIQGFNHAKRALKPGPHAGLLPIPTPILISEFATVVALLIDQYDVATAEIGFKITGFNRWKFGSSLVAFCRSRIFLL